MTKQRAKIAFFNYKLRDRFNKLASSKTESKNLYKHLKRAFDDLESDPHCGVWIRKSEIPKKYIANYGVENLWKYDLPGAWRLLYTLTNEGPVVVAVILHWGSHTDYERRFGF